jgi:hypothetical protein
VRQAARQPSHRSSERAGPEAPRRLVSRQLRTFSVPDLAVELVEPPPAALPPKLKAKVYFDAAKEPHHLHFLGPMTDAERVVLVVFGITCIGVGNGMRDRPEWAQLSW